MQIISYNVNGLRSISSKGTLENLISSYSPDIICLQETRCDDTFMLNNNLYPFWKIKACSSRKGYSGVAIFSKIKPINIIEDFPENDEGRVLVFEFEDFYLINTYTPNTKPDLSRLSYRIDVWEPCIRSYISKLQQTKSVIYVGDLNVAPTELDIYSTKGKKNMHGFTKEERNAFQELIHECNLVDIYRHQHPNEKKYSWFSYLGKAKEHNRGWRIDHILISKNLIDRVSNTDILNNISGSDHCPIYLSLE